MPKIVHKMQYDEQKKKKWEPIRSAMHVNSNLRSKNKEKEQSPFEQYQQYELSSSFKNDKLRYYAETRERIFSTNKPKINEYNLESSITGDSDYQSDIRESHFSKSKPEIEEFHSEKIENTITDNGECRKAVKLEKTPITLLNEWAMRKYGYGHKKKYVLYELVSITGKAHKPIFTFMCRVQDKFAKADGNSKRDAKQNSAAQLWIKIDGKNSGVSVQHPTSTTSNDNFEFNENNTESIFSIEESQRMEINSDNKSIESKQFNNEAVQIAQCNINPVGTLQELCTLHNWVPPSYVCQDLGISQEERFEVTCRVFHLQTAETGSSKRKAKHKAARLMFDLIHDTGIEVLNNLKHELNTIASKKDYENKCINNNNVDQEENQECPQDLMSAKYFRSYFTDAVSAAANNLYSSEFGSSCSSSDTNSDQYSQKKMIRNQLTKEMEQYISNDDSNLKAIDKLLMMSDKLDFQVVFVILSGGVAQNTHKTQPNSNQNSEYSVLVQVTTVPTFVNIGHGFSTDVAIESAAKNILYMFKTMLHSKHRRNFKCI